MKTKTNTTRSPERIYGASYVSGSIVVNTTEGTFGIPWELFLASTSQNDTMKSIANEAAIALGHSRKSHTKESLLQLVERWNNMARAALAKAEGKA